MLLNFNLKKAGAGHKNVLKYAFLPAIVNFKISQNFAKISISSKRR